MLVEPKAVFVSSIPSAQKPDRLVEFHRDRLRFVYEHYGAGTWPEGFQGAEMSLLDTAPRADIRAVRLAYLWRLAESHSRDPTEIKSLLDLYKRARWLEQKSSSTAAAQLQTHRFVSSVPIVGQVIARLRNMWGNVAARWYSESLVQQQNRLNQTIFERVIDLSNELSELEMLVVRLGTDQAAPFSEEDSREEKESSEPAGKKDPG